MLRMVLPPRNGEGGCHAGRACAGHTLRRHHRACAGDPRQGRRLARRRGGAPPTMLRMVPPPRNGEGGCKPDGPVPDTHSAVITGLVPVIRDGAAASHAGTRMEWIAASGAAMTKGGAGRGRVGAAITMRLNPPLRGGRNRVSDPGTGGSGAASWTAASMPRAHASDVGHDVVAPHAHQTVAWAASQLSRSRSRAASATLANCPPSTSTIRPCCGQMKSTM